MNSSTYFAAAFGSKNDAILKWWESSLANVMIKIQGFMDHTFIHHITR